MKLLLSILSLSIILSSCGKEDSLEFPLADDSGCVVEYSIIDALLKHQYSEETFLHVSQSTISNSHHWYESVVFPLLGSDSLELEAFRAQDTIPHVWGDSFTSDITFFTDEENQSLLDADVNFWAAYYEAHEESNGYLRFSKPYYINENQTEAIVINEMYCGFLCAYGFLATLEKQDGRWVVIENQLVWIS